MRYGQRLIIMTFGIPFWMSDLCYQVVFTVTRDKLRIITIYSATLVALKMSSLVLDSATTFFFTTLLHLRTISLAMLNLTPLNIASLIELPKQNSLVYQKDSNPMKIKSFRNKSYLNWVSNSVQSGRYRCLSFTVFVADCSSRRLNSTRSKGKC